MGALPVISIIMPLYNVAAYLEAAVNSVLGQHFTDFELILVDDGSKDASASLCARLAAADSRIRILQLAHNGTSRARNAGIDMARGEFIGFVDADDWIEPDMFTLLYENSLSHDSDISACGFLKIADRSCLMFTSDNAPIAVLAPAEALKSTFMQGHMRYSACNKLFRRKLFDSVRYPEHRQLEDKGTTYRLIHQANRVAWCPAPKYHYFMRPDSTMHAPFSKSSLDIFPVNEELLGFLKAQYPNLVLIAGASYAVECFRLLEKMRAAGYDDADVFAECVGIIRRYQGAVWRYPVTDARTKCRMQMLCCFPKR